MPTSASKIRNNRMYAFNQGDNVSFVRVAHQVRRVIAEDASTPSPNAMPSLKLMCWRYTRFYVPIETEFVTNASKNRKKHNADSP